MSDLSVGISGAEWHIDGRAPRDVEIVGDCDCGWNDVVEAERCVVQQFADSALVVDFWTCPYCGEQREHEHEEQSE